MGSEPKSQIDYNHAAMNLYPLLDTLFHAPSSPAFEWQGWYVERVTGGRNNLLFHATRNEQDIAVKFTRRDARDRAGREFNSLSVLSTLGLAIAPLPVLLDRDRFPLPVIVQTWMKGEASAKAPANREDWTHLLEHYAVVHTIAPDYVHRSVAHAVMDFSSAQEAVRYVLGEIGAISEHQRPAELVALARRLELANLPAWHEPEITLGRCDPFIANFIRRPAAWASVDWENSGWCDPAFEIGDLMTHPCYRTISEDTWEWYVEAAADCHPGDTNFVERVRTYRTIMQVRWAGVFARYCSAREKRAAAIRSHADPAIALSSTQANLSPLTDLPETWWEEVPGEYQRYLRLAGEAFSG